tara:strand:- start:80 stop:556 length:477 start_codon:yes stop_codon:yes gene_type:complete
MTSLVNFGGFSRKRPVQQLQLILVLAATLSLSGCNDFLCWPFECGSDKTSSAVADDSQSTETVSSNLPPLGPTGIIWKPVSEGDHKLAIVLPQHYSAPTLTVRGMSGAVIDTGNYIGRTNGNRPTYRFGRAGGGYPNPCILRVGTTDYLISNPANRVN